jgi:signal transduction histidine kinase
VDQKRILLVEDDRRGARSLRPRLQRLGYGVVGIASDSETALQLAETLRPDLVLIDLHSWVSVGCSAAAEQLAARQHVPVVCVASSADDASMAYALRAEPYGYLIRPFGAPELRAVIEMAIARFAAEQRQRARERFLADAGAVLVSSLDYATTLQSVTRLVVPAHADWCSVLLLNREGRLERVALACDDPEKRRVTRALDAYALSSDQAFSYGEALRAGRSRLLPEITPEINAARAVNREHFELMERLGLRSMVFVPLQARGRPLGILSLATINSPRRYGPDDLALAEALAQRVALAIDNARLYHEAQEAIARRDETLALLDTMFASAPVGVAFLDTDLRYVRVNRALAEINNRPIEAHIGRRFRDLEPLMAERHEPLMRAVLQTGQPLKDIEIGGPRPGAPNQSGAWLISYYPVCTPDSRPLGIGAVVLDITERKQAEHDRLSFERRLLETQRLESLGVLAGGIAHDFNNLLAIIIGNVGLAQLDLPPDSPLAEPLAQVDNAAHRAADLTRQMLAYAGYGHFAMQPLQLNRLIRDMATLLHTSTGRADPPVYQLAPELPMVEGDASQIRQALLALVTNAAEALSEASGTITISTGERLVSRQELATAQLGNDLPEGVYVYLKVTDTGCGMDDATLSRIFDPFFTTKFVGRGLGLPAVMGIVRGHHGALKVTSRQGVGTTVTILLPRSRDRGPASDGRPPRRAPTEQTLVLLLDDDPHSRDQAIRALEQAGYLVRAAGASAIELLQTCRGDAACVLVDPLLPTVDQAALARELRVLRETTPLVYLGAPPPTHEMLAGPAIVVPRPFSPDELLAAVQQALGRSEP